ncbi:MAG: hypothetical protein PHE78_07535, partial [Candidatus Gastranaerophilales bacterium]|nr:hypothetical protein [Candidatus Gastranaerophilales bacterium]
MIISAVGDYSKYIVNETNHKKNIRPSKINTTPSNKKKENKNYAKNIGLGIGFLVAGFTADLFLAKGKALSTLTQGKVSFIKNMSDEIDNVLKKDSYATKNRLEAFLSVPGLHAIWNHKIIHKLHKAKIPVLPRFLANTSRFFTGIEIHPGAEIGKNLFIDHTGAIIGETAKIGDNVTLIGRVVLGSTGKDKYLRHTIVEDDVTMGI